MAIRSAPPAPTIGSNQVGRPRSLAERQELSKRRKLLTQAMTLALALYLFQNDSGLRGNNGLSGLQNLPGLSIAVGVGGEIVWGEGFGWADLEKRLPVSPETKFRMGTASIALTSAGVGLLLEQGRLRLDDEIQAYVPAFPKKPWPVTLRQVLSHTAGVRTDSGDEGPLYGQQCERPESGHAGGVEGEEVLGDLVWREVAGLDETACAFDDALSQHGVLDPGIALIEKPFRGAALVTRIEEVLNG